MKISIGKANLFSIGLIIPIIIVFLGPYLLLWTSDTELSFIELLKETFLQPIKERPYLTLVIILFGVLVHELLHGISWARYTGNGMKDIKFGVIWSMLTPYCRCEVPLNVKHFLFGLLAPGIALGLLPAIYGLVSQNAGIMLFGMFFTLVGGGDYLLAWNLRKESMDSLVKDHPTAVGYFIYEDKEEHKSPS